MIEKKKVIEKYELSETIQDVSNYVERLATIIFEDKVFMRCDFVGLEKTYTLEDWEFLRKVAEKIKKIK